MTTYTFELKTGLTLGTYTANTAEDALRLLLRDADTDPDDAHAPTLDGFIVTEGVAHREKIKSIT